MIKFVPLNCELDDLFGEGVRTRTITQIYGPPASGKTNIALQATLNCVRQGKKVAFIDTEGSFNQERMKQIAGKNYQRVLDNTYLFEPGNFSEQAKAINELEKAKNLGLIVVDSMVYHYRLEFDREDRHKSSRELGLQVAQLLDIARKKNVAVLITNQVYTNPDTKTIEPVAGDTLKYASKVVVSLDNGAERTAKLVKHQFKKSGKTTTFKIVQNGVK